MGADYIPTCCCNDVCRWIGWLVILVATLHGGTILMLDAVAGLMNHAVLWKVSFALLVGALMDHAVWSL